MFDAPWFLFPLFVHYLLRAVDLGQTTLVSLVPTPVLHAIGIARMSSLSRFVSPVSMISDHALTTAGFSAAMAEGTCESRAADKNGKAPASAARTTSCRSASAMCARPRPSTRTAKPSTAQQRKDSRRSASEKLSRRLTSLKADLPSEVPGGSPGASGRSGDPPPQRPGKRYYRGSRDRAV